MKNFIIPVIIIVLMIAGLVFSDTAPKDKLLSFFYPTFYMKVIDQDNRPVEGLEIDVIHGKNYWISSNLATAKYISDADGVISIKVDHRQITLKQMKKKNYYVSLPDILFEYYKTRSFRVPPGSLWPEDFEKFSQSKPFIITAWREDPKEQKATCKNGFIRDIKLNADGRSYGIDLLQPYRKVVEEGSFGRSIQISFKREDVESPASEPLIKRNIFKKKWQYDINMTDGGLVEISPENMYQKTPPNSGYLKSWHLDNSLFTPINNAYSAATFKDQRHFFLKINNNHYARLSINFAPIGMHLDEFKNGEITIDYSVDVDATGYVRGFSPQGVHDRENTCVNL